MMVSCGGELSFFFNFKSAIGWLRLEGKQLPTTTGIQDGPSGMLYKL